MGAREFGHRVLAVEHEAVVWRRSWGQPARERLLQPGGAACDSRLGSERRRLAAGVALVRVVLGDVVHDLAQRVAVQRGRVARLARAEGWRRHARARCLSAQLRWGDSRRRPGVCCSVTDVCSWTIGGRVFSALYRRAVIFGSSQWLFLALLVCWWVCCCCGDVARSHRY